MGAETSTPAVRETDAAETADAGGLRPARRRFALPAAWVVPVLSLLWLAFELWSAHGAVRDSADLPTRLIHGWYALPGVVQAAFVAGAGAGLLARHTAVTTGKRYALAVPAGLAAGGIAATLTGIRYPYAPSIGGITAVIAVAGALGGAAAAAVRTKPAVVAGLTGMIVALAVAAYLNTARVGDWMLNLYGKGTSGASEYAAGKLVQYTDFLLCGLLAGVIAAVLLRRAKVRAAPLHGMAGAAAGIMLLIAYALVEIGGHSLLGAANAIDAPTKLMNELEWNESVPNALIVLFVGTLAALVGYGRSLRKNAPVTAR